MKPQNDSEIARLLPKREVYFDNRCYCIHGLLHGNSFVSINPSVKKEISKQFAEHNLICEDVFASWIPGSKSFEEVTYFGMNKFSLQGMFFALKYLISVLTPRREPEVITNVRQMGSIEDMNQIRERLFQDYLPEPEGMNSFMAERNKGTLDQPLGELPLRIKRYVYEAKRAIEYAEDKNFNEVHIVVGCAHELPLEYLLKNPDVLSKLEDYLS